MATIPCWLWRRALADRPVAMLLGLTAVATLLPPAVGDGVLVLLAMVSIATTSALAIARPTAGTKLGAFVIVLLAVGKVAQPHLPLGALLAAELKLPPAFGLVAAQQGKLVIAGALGMACLIAAWRGRRVAVDGTGRTLSALALWLCLGPAAAAALLDMLGMGLGDRRPRLTVGIEGAERVAELLLLGAAAAGGTALRGAIGGPRLRRLPSRPMPSGCAT